MQTTKLPPQGRAPKGATAAHAESFPSLREIRKSLSDDCFHLSTPKALFYTLRDLCLVVFLAYLGLHYVAQSTGWVAGILWPTYWFLQGTAFWALFVLGHDSGHKSLSHNRWINHGVGLLSHSLILVPYIPWALTHKHHHMYTGNLRKEELYAPFPQKAGSKSLPKTHWKYQLQRALVGGLGTFWFAYIWGNLSLVVSSHLNPFDKLLKKNFLGSMLSVLGFFLMVGVICAAGFSFGWMNVLLHYGIPLFIFGSWLVVTTFLHHNHDNARWYSEKEWTFVKGALSSVDRSYGIFNWLVHDIGTHQIHHVFPSIPHYNLKKATRQFRKAFPQLVLEDHSSILLSFYKQTWCYIKEGYFDTRAQTFCYADAKKGRKRIE